MDAFWISLAVYLIGTIATYVFTRRYRKLYTELSTDEPLTAKERYRILIYAFLSPLLSSLILDSGLRRFPKKQKQANKITIRVYVCILLLILVMSESLGASGMVLVIFFLFFNIGFLLMVLSYTPLFSFWNMTGFSIIILLFLYFFRNRIFKQQ